MKHLVLFFCVFAFSSQAWTQGVEGTLDLEYMKSMFLNLETMMTTTPAPVAPMAKLALLARERLTLKQYQKDVGADFSNLVEVIVEIRTKVGDVEPLGKIDILSNVVEGAQGKVNSAWALNIVRLVCMNYRVVGRTADCNKLLEALAKRNDASIQAQLKIEKLKSKHAIGQLNEVYSQGKEMADQLRASKDGMLPWLDLFLAETEITLGKLDEAKASVEEFLEFFKNNKYIRQEVRLYGYRARLNVLFEQGEMAEAQKQADELAQKTAEALSGSSLAGAWFALTRQVFAGLKGDLKECESLAQEVKQQTKDMAAARFVSEFSIAVLAAAKGTYKPSMLNSVRKLVGAQHPLIKDFERNIAAIIKKQPHKKTK